MRRLFICFWLAACAIGFTACQSTTTSSAPEAVEANDSLLTDDDLATTDAADLPPVPYAQLPQDVQALLADLRNTTTQGNQLLTQYVDPQHPVQYLHESNSQVPNLDALTAGELLGVSDLAKWLAVYKPDSTEHYLAPATFNACEPREPGVYIVSLQEPFTVLSSLYTNRMEETGGELNPRKLEDLRKVDNETRQIIQVWRHDASGTLASVRLFLRRAGGRLYISGIDATDCN